MIRHNMYEELCRIREILAMQTVIQGIALKDGMFDTADPHELAMADHYTKMMEKALVMAFPERTLRKYTEEELCDICLKPREICRGEHA
jgi:hypothetical protein